MEEIAADLFMVTLPMPFRLMHVNVFVLAADDGLVLFDTGLNTPENLSIMEAELGTINRRLEDITHVFLSHFHIDHCGMAGRIKEISGAEIHMSALSKKLIMGKGALDTGPEERFCLLHGLPEETTRVFIGMFLDSMTTAGFFSIDSYYGQGRMEKAYGRRFEVVPTPGHTHDHVSFFFPDERILLSGDHVLPDITPNLSADLFSPGFRPLANFLASLAKVRELAVSRVCPAHGRPFEDLPGRIKELIRHHEVRKKLVLSSVKGGTKTAFQASRDVFGCDLPEFDQYLALNETYVHLLELKNEGAIGEERAAKNILYTPIS